MTLNLPKLKLSFSEGNNNNYSQISQGFVWLDIYFFDKIN